MWTTDGAKMVGLILILLLSSQVNLRLIIMWSVPFNFNLRDSYYAIGLTHNKVPVGLPVFCNGFEISGEISKLCVLVPPDVLRDQQRIQKKSNRWKKSQTHSPLLHHHLDLQVEASRSPPPWSQCTGSWKRTPTTRFSTYPSSLAGDPVTIQCDNQTWDLLKTLHRQIFRP